MQRLGAHNAADNQCFLSAKSLHRVERPCQISDVFDLRRGGNLVRSQFGGAVILVSRDQNKNAGATVSVDKAFQAPYFIRGKTSQWQWQEQVSNTPVPWAELEGEQCVLHLPVAVAKTIADPEKLLVVHDRIVENCRWLAGMNKAQAGVPQKQRIAQDIIQVDPDTIFGGLPVTVDERWRIDDLDHMNYWGVFRQLAYNFLQLTPLMGVFDKGALTGLFALYNQEQFGQVSRLVTEQCYSQAIAKVCSGQMVLAEADPLEQLVFLMQIKHFVAAAASEDKGEGDAGWLLYRKLNSYYSKLPDNSKKLIVASQKMQFDSLYKTASLFSGYDLREHFAAWQVPISDGAQLEVEQLFHLAIPQQNISQINPEQPE